jgi:hypothetical protein
MREEDYQKHEGIIVKVLGWQAMKDGEGVEPYLKACRTYNPECGSFSTWLWNNLALRKKKMEDATKKQLDTISLDDILSASLDDPCLSTGDCSIERQLDFRKAVMDLSEDAKTIVHCLFEGVASQPLKRRRTNFKEDITVSRKKLRREIKDHCRNCLEWSWPRYWAAVHEIEKMLTKLK